MLSPPPTPGAEPGRRTIVVADDDRVVRERVARLLRSSGFEVVECTTGNEVLEHYRRGGVSLALVDGVMPEMGGLECCRLLKAMSGDVFFPVILFTSRADPKSRVEGLRNGADDFVSKPFDDGELVARIENMLRIRDMHNAVHAAKANLEALAGRDEASPLYSEPYLRNRLYQEFKRSERYQQPLALILAQVHGLEALGFEFGGAVAKALFSEIASRAVKNIRETDIGARYERHGMALVLPSTHFQGSLIVAERVWRSLTSTPLTVDGQAHSLRVTFGVALFPSREVGKAEDLITRAKSALEHLQHHPSDSICVAQHTAYLFRPSAEPPPAP